MMFMFTRRNISILSTQLHWEASHSFWLAHQELEKTLWFRRSSRNTREFSRRRSATPLDLRNQLSSQAIITSSSPRKNF